MKMELSFLKNPHSIRIHNENSLLEDKKIKFKYDYRIIIDNDQHM